MAGLTEGFAVAMGQELPYDEQGNVLGGTLDGLSSCRHRMETPALGDRFHRHSRLRTIRSAPRVSAESPHVGSIPCFSNAMIDAFAHLGTTHFNMPYNSYRVWQHAKWSGFTNFDFEGQNSL